MNVATLPSGTPLALFPPETSAFDAKPTAPVRTTGDLLSILSEKTEASRTEISLPEAVRDSLVTWKKLTPYSAPEDWVFASPATHGQRPMWPDSMLADYIRPIAEKGGFGRIGWHTFRHSLTSWGKQVLTLEETKELARHANIQTTSNIYGGLSLDAKRTAQSRLVTFVHEAGGKSSVEGNL